MLILRRRPGEGFWVVDSDSGHVAYVHLASVGSGRSRQALTELPVKLQIEGTEKLRFLRDDMLTPEDIAGFQKRMDQQVAAEQAAKKVGN
jgi:hypothetical protein